MKKKRTDSSFGIHFDFHAERGDSVAHIFKPDLTAKLLDIVKPDFVQCDTKGHPGLSSYPTIVGTRADSIKEDILKTWRILTNERDIALYGHHSGLYDIAAAQEHPEWAIVDENNIVSHEYISPFSDYCDKRLIPQLKELALNYKLDGAWVDGECWAAYVDYSENAQKKYKEKHGKSAPHRGDDGYEEYRNFCRQGFLDYVRHYTEEIHKIAPDFLITSNWIFSAYMPTAKNVSVDFLSGDYSSSNSVSSARYNGRCLETRKMTWDLLSWGQNAVPCSWQTHNRNMKPSGIYYDDNIYESQSHTGCFIKNYGKGCIMSFCFDFSDTYENNRTASLEDFLKSRISDIGFEPIVRIKNNSFVDVILRKKGDNLLVNLINFSGNHALQNVRTYREIPPLVDIDLEIICDSTPNSVFLEPEHRKLCGKYSNGILSLNIDRVDIHSTIIINGGLKK